MSIINNDFYSSQLFSLPEETMTVNKYFQGVSNHNWQKARRKTQNKDMFIDAFITGKDIQLLFIIRFKGKGRRFKNQNESRQMHQFGNPRGKINFRVYISINWIGNLVIWQFNCVFFVTIYYYKYLRVICNGIFLWYEIYKTRIST